MSFTVQNGGATQHTVYNGRRMPNDGEIWRSQSQMNRKLVSFILCLLIIGPELLVGAASAAQDAEGDEIRASHGSHSRSL